MLCVDKIRLGLVLSDDPALSSFLSTFKILSDDPAFVNLYINSMVLGYALS